MNKKKQNLEKARKEYPTGSLFYTATNNIKQYIKVGIVREAEHLDRYAEIRHIEAIDKKSKRLKYLKSLERDIVSSEGGVIYCSENRIWAKKGIKI